MQRTMPPEVTHKLQMKDIVWRNVLIFVYMHAASAYAIYQIATGEARFSTWCIGEWLTGNMFRMTAKSE